MVERAIELGFKKYSITEHAPLPKGIIDDPVLAADFTLLPDQLEDYFAHIKELKHRYVDKIKVCVGLEVDYIASHRTYFNEFVEACSKHLDDLIVSVHMIQGKNGIAPIDFSPESFESELLNCYDSIENVHWAYWSDVEKMVLDRPEVDITARIGHLGLINKYIKQYPVSYNKDRYEPFFDGLFSMIKQKGWDLDFNVAGLKKELCHDMYISDWMLELCGKYGINLIYGSDAHDVASVGQFYDRYQRLIGEDKDE